MTSKDFTRIFYFLQQTNKLSKEDRWVLMSIISYQTIAGIYNDEDKVKPIRVFADKFKSHFEVTETDFVNELGVLQNLYEFVTYKEVDNSKGTGRAFDITINWEKLEAFRIDSLPQKKNNNNEITPEVIMKVISLLNEGKINLNKNV